LLEGSSAVQKLSISVIAKIARPEPDIIDVNVVLIDGTTALLRLNAFEAQSLVRRLAAIDRAQKRPPKSAPNMGDRLSARECKALKMLGNDPAEFLTWGELVGIGPATLASLVTRGLAEIGRSRKYSPVNGWRITDDGWRCMYGKTFSELLGKPVGVKKPFVVWKWPVDPNGTRRPI
jgi:hypothetical protein